MKLVELLNAIDTNATALLVIAAGVVLAVTGNSATGATLITGGFALLQRNR